jgi:hypothetical protein
MSYRTEAVLRVLGLVYLVTIWPIVALIGAAAGFVYMVIDVILQFAYNTEAYDTSTGGFHAALLRVFWWPVRQGKWIILGSGTFPILP